MRELLRHSDIAFHFRVYFGHWVVMNSRVCGAWQDEVTCHNMPFEDGKPFDLCISVRDNEYQLFRIISCVWQHLFCSSSLKTFGFYFLPPSSQLWVTPKRNWAISSHSQWELLFVELKCMHSLNMVQH
uniref:Galectin n=1 Tax=Aotus nancymaae TaxID=37293 RepID=A0A2K5EPS8_AOTNA